MKSNHNIDKNQDYDKASGPKSNNDSSEIQESDLINYLGNSEMKNIQEINSKYNLHPWSEPKTELNSQINETFGRLHNFYKKQDFVYDIKYKLEQINKFINNMIQFQNMSGPLLEMIDFSLKENKIGWLGSYYSSCKKIKSPESASTKDWESFIFIELIKQNIYHILQRQNICSELLNWAKQIALGTFNQPNTDQIIKDQQIDITINQKDKQDDNNIVKLFVGSKYYQQIDLNDPDLSQKFERHNITYLKMIHRMQTIYSDDSIISQERKDFFKNRYKHTQKEVFETINLNALTLTLEKFNQIYENILEFSNQMLTQKISRCGKTFKEFYSICSKLFIMDRWVWGSMFAQNTEIYYLKKDHPKWQAIDSVTQEINLDSDETMNNDYNKFIQNMNAGMATMSRTYVKNMGYRKMFKAFAYMSVYYLIQSKRDRQFRFFSANPDLETSKGAFNVLDAYQIKNILGFFQPQLESNKLIRVPKLDEKMTLENLHYLKSLDNWQNFDFKDRLSEIQEISESQANEQFDDENFSQIRILSDIENQNQIQKDTLIIHIHGGGFISMSSGSHLNYTKIWAKMIKRAIICSIDYRLAPKSRFPCQLEDVWQAYFWLVINCKDYFGFDPKRVIVIGDSAGGNLALSITTMAIQRRFRIPSGLVPIYACTICSVCEFWPSLLLSLDEALINQFFLALCTTSYNPKGMLYHDLVRTNEYISPGMYTNNETLLKFPRSRIIIGGLDPFKDDNYRLVHRLLQAGAKDVLAKEFRMLSHGFLGFHQPLGTGMSQSLSAINMVGNFIIELIQKDELF